MTPRTADEKPPGLAEEIVPRSAVVLLAVESAILADVTDPVRIVFAVRIDRARRPGRDP